MIHRIALIQMVSGVEVQANLASLSRLIERAAQEGVEAIFLPENFATLGNPAPWDIGALEVSSTGPIRSAVADLARGSNCWIFAGTLPTISRPDGDDQVSTPRVRAASYVYDSSGIEVSRYDKIHMFDVEVADNHKHYMESATFEPGETLACIDSPIGLVGLSVCYDIRFPELYRKLFVEGATSFTIPSAFTQTTGKAHFEILMRSRAIENFSFTIAACQGGDHDSGRKTHGHSMVVSPWGDVLAEAASGEDVIIAELDFGRLAEIRADMPVRAQMRLSV